ncbi:hypothetical protein [Donghicola mangrovi]|uniref:Uncharacterized protein n=1 Tax=Donghicola mangrovi TaxID=2729614 RepID=A0A850QEN3_9RHOB|nr:hypothetical protein [Donghicola mangrovi]NVO25408.1 hypothetical protein [Donghicola mangrovi]
MATAVAITRPAQTKSTRDYSAHILRRNFLQLLTDLDTATAAELELTWASEGLPGGMGDPAVSKYLRESESAWDRVTDCLAATTAAATGVGNCCVLRKMTYCLRSVLSAESAGEFDREIAAARRLIAETCILPNASVADRDFFTVLQAVAARLDGLDSLDLFRSGAPDPQPNLH